MHLIHLIDVARLSDGVCALCGAAGEDPTWTTIPQVVTCPACERAVALAAVPLPSPGVQATVARGTPRAAGASSAASRRRAQTVGG